MEIKEERNLESDLDHHLIPVPPHLQNMNMIMIIMTLMIRMYDFLNKCKGRWLLRPSQQGMPEPRLIIMIIMIFWLGFHSHHPSSHDADDQGDCQRG